MNTNYGKRISKRKIQYAPNQVQVGGTMYSKPTAEQYLAAGWKPVEDVKPAYKEGYDIYFVKWDEDDAKITAVYDYVEVCPVVESFDISKLKLHVALANLGIWDGVKEWMSGMSIELSAGHTINCYEAFAEAQSLNTGNPMFQPYLEMAKEQFKDYVTPEQVDEIIRNCKAD